MSGRESTAAGVDHDVVVVGGGPAGCSAAVFAAREGLDTVVFDRGRSSIAQCAHLENYPGFPAGVDVETFYDLLHDHVDRAGGEVVADRVESVDRRADGEGFVVAPAETAPVTARRVVAATRYGGEYLRGLDDDAAMFETDGVDDAERFDREYADDDGTTAVEGLYVASPSPAADRQALLAAGRGARVGRRVVADARIDDGWWEAVAAGVDWVRREADLDGDWDREAWVEWFDEYFAPTAPADADAERVERVRAAAIERRRDTYLDDDAVATRRRAGHEALAGHLDPAAVVAGCDETALLDAMDDETVREYATERTAAPEAGE